MIGYINILHCSLFHQSKFYYNTKRFDGYSVIFISGTKIMYINYSTIYSTLKVRHTFYRNHTKMGPKGWLAAVRLVYILLHKTETWFVYFRGFLNLILRYSSWSHFLSSSLRWKADWILLQWCERNVITNHAGHCLIDKWSDLHNYWNQAVYTVYMEQDKSVEMSSSGSLFLHTCSPICSRLECPQWKKDLLPPLYRIWWCNHYLFSVYSCKHI